MFIVFVRYFCGIVMLLLASLVLAQPEPMKPLIEPGYRPKVSSDEGGFWYKIDQLEEKIKTSSYVVKDEELNRYINGLVCQLAGDHCSNIRVYIIDNPHFNASMYPNGMMHIWTGLLLRIENEAQLASVLAHEIAHYLRTHQITQWRKLRSSLAFTSVLDVMLTGGLATLALAGSTASFSRSQEKEADIYGVQLMVANNYHPDASWKLWQYITHEREKDKSKSKRGSFFASHPHTEDRSEYLQELSQHYGHIDSKGQSDRFMMQMKHHYVQFMTGAIALREYEQVQELISRHRQIGYPAAYVDFFEAEMYRLRDDEGDRVLAINAYQSAIKASATLVPVTAYRGLAYLYLKEKDKVSAKYYFQQYIQLQPEANDKEMILFHLDSLEGI